MAMALVKVIKLEIMWRKGVLNGTMSKTINRGYYKQICELKEHSRSTKNT